MDCDSPYEHIRLRSEAILNQEICYAQHLSIPHLVLDFPQNRDSIENFSRIIYSYISNVQNSTKFVMKIKVPADPQQSEFIYRQYMSFKRLCGFHPFGLGGLLLELDTHVPSLENFMHRWFSEQVAAI